MKLRGTGDRQAARPSTRRIIWLRGGDHGAQSAMELLLHVFPDQDPHIVSENADRWIFGLDWPEHLLSHTDPVLSDYAARCYDLPLAELAGYFEVRRSSKADFVFSMFHSWAILAPSLAWQRRGRPLRCIVHVDAHTDLGPPLLAVRSPGSLENLAFDFSCDLNQPVTVEQAIKAALIHKGNFLATYLLAVPNSQLFHCWEEAAPGSDMLQRVRSEIQIGMQTVVRDQLVFADGTIGETQDPKWPFQRSLRLPSLDAEAAADGVWLDIDLDAFCNRFDGDSDRRGQAGLPEELKTLRTRIANFLEQLGAASWRSHIEAVSIAASPGFFPSEYWEESIPAVCHGIEKLLVDS